MKKETYIKKQITKIAMKLVSFKTLEAKEEEIRKLYKYVSGLFSKKIYKVSLFEFETSPVLVVEPRLLKPSVYTCCHIDVVPGSDEQFNPKISENKLYERGSHDMKTQAALTIALLLNSPTFGLILTSDEENAKANNGAKFIAKKLKNKAKIVIVPDGEAGLCITNRVRGMGEYKIISKGKAARYSYPWKGVNPYVNLFKFYLNLDELFTDASKASDRDIWHTTYNLISTDAVDGSQVPEIGNMDILVNCTTEFNNKSLLKALQKYGERFNCKVQEVFFGAPYEVSSNNENLIKFKQLLDKHSEITGKLVTMGAITDVRHFSELGIETILCRIDGSGAHSSNEYSNLDSAVILYNTLEDFILSS